MEEKCGGLTPVQALGVALSVVLGDTEMGECQDIAIGIIKHLKAMGFKIVINKE
jgi:hypothetical protein